LKKVYIYIILKCYTNAKSSGWPLRGAAGRANRDFGRQGSTGAGAAATAAGHATRPGTRGASDVAVGPTRTEAGDSTGSVAGGAAAEWAGHGLLVHDRLHDDRSGQHAQTGGELAEHHRTHGF